MILFDRGMKGHAVDLAGATFFATQVEDRWEGLPWTVVVANRDGEVIRVGCYATGEEADELVYTLRWERQLHMNRHQLNWASRR